MLGQIHDLRSALEFLKSEGETIEYVNDNICSKFDVARHYVKNSAGVPASSSGRDENVIMYNNVDGKNIPVLMGLFGSRRRNQLLLTGKKESYHGAFFGALQNRIKPSKVDDPQCQQVVIDTDIDLTSLLPILQLTPECSGPYIALGFVLARDESTGSLNASVHRLCVQSRNTLSISIFPGNHLGILYAEAQKKGKSLPISINIGLDPAIYFASSLTEPICNKGESELDIVGGLRGKPIEISKCLSVDVDCISSAEIVLEAEITSTQIAENNTDPTKGSMPEFLGYQGAIPPGTKIPLVKVLNVTHREDPIYQTLVGPGKEQSEILSITPEIATKGFLKQHFPDSGVVDVLYTTSGGGVLMAVIKVKKNSSDQDKNIVAASLKILEIIPPLKHIYIVNDDIAADSSDDLLWAMTTRFQADQDLHTMENKNPFLMDPSQTQRYRVGTTLESSSCKAVFDCSFPWEMSSEFQRPFVRS